MKSTAATPEKTADPNTTTPHVPLPAPPIDLKPAQPAKTKRDNTFSKSRDVREDRGTRQGKTSQNTRPFTHTRQS
jgi:hypothetical protein